MHRGLLFCPLCDSAAYPVLRVVTPEDLAKRQEPGAAASNTSDDDDDDEDGDSGGDGDGDDGPGHSAGPSLGGAGAGTTGVGAIGGSRAPGAARSAKGGGSGAAGRAPPRRQRAGARAASESGSYASTDDAHDPHQDDLVSQSEGMVVEEKKGDDEDVHSDSGAEEPLLLRCRRLQAGLRGYQVAQGLSVGGPVPAASRVLGAKSSRWEEGGGVGVGAAGARRRAQRPKADNPSDGGVGWRGCPHPSSSPSSPSSPSSSDDGDVHPAGGPSPPRAAEVLVVADRALARDRARAGAAVAAPGPAGRRPPRVPQAAVIELTDSEVEVRERRQGCLRTLPPVAACFCVCAMVRGRWRCVVCSLGWVGAVAAYGVYTLGWVCGLGGGGGRPWRCIVCERIGVGGEREQLEPLSWSMLWCVFFL